MSELWGDRTEPGENWSWFKWATYWLGLWKPKPITPTKPGSAQEIIESGKFSYHDLDQAVLHILNPYFKASKVGVEIGSTTEQTILYEKQLLSSFRNWLKTQTDACIISAYEHWLGFYERHVVEAEQALRANVHAKAALEWAKSRAEFDRIHEIAQKIPRPK